MTIVSRSIIIGSVVPAVCVVLFGMLFYSPAPPGPNPPGHFYEHLTRGQALMVEILPASVGCIIPGAIIGGVVGLILRWARRPRSGKISSSPASDQNAWPPPPTPPSV